MSKNEFIIWNYLEDPIRVEKSKNLLKTYTHRCEPSASQKAWQSRFLNKYIFLKGLGLPRLPFGSLAMTKDLRLPRPPEAGSQ
jgi:hypothetical protein